MAIKALEKILERKIKFEFIWDLPHNWIEFKENDTFIHRKGTCPCYENEPVIIPGSMGDKSFILNGLGNSNSLYSGPHGAGRKKKRGEGRKEKLDSSIFVISKIDHKNLRKVIKEKVESSLMEEAPSCYKDISPIIDSVEEFKIAERLVELKPIFTLKDLYNL